MRSSAPSSQATAATANAPLPQAAVSPTPRSSTRMLSSCDAPKPCTTSTFTPVGNRSSQARTRAAKAGRSTFGNVGSSFDSSKGNTACGFQNATACPSLPSANFKGSTSKSAKQAGKCNSIAPLIRRHSTTRPAICRRPRSAAVKHAATRKPFKQAPPSEPSRFKMRTGKAPALVFPSTNNPS